MQVRAHKVRKRRRIDPDSPQLDFSSVEPEVEQNIEITPRRRSSWWDDQPMPTVAPAATHDLLDESNRTQSEHQHEREFVVSAESPGDQGFADGPVLSKTQMEEPFHSSDEAFHRPPLAPFPRINSPVPKVIEFPRPLRQYELAEPVVDQLRIFEAEEELFPPPPTHLNEIELMPEEPAHFGADEIEVPLQAAPLGQRAFAAAVDLGILICATILFVISVQFFAGSLPTTKPLAASAAICIFLLLTLYYSLSLSLSRSTAGIEAAALHVVTFSGDLPKRKILRWRALATVLSYAALGMGFAWSLIDEDQLCWHDRITHTYLTPKR